MEFVIILTFVVICLLLIQRSRKFAVFKKHGIPGPPPSIFLGNSWDLYRRGPFICHKEWIKKYGRVFGYYYGVRPVLVITDPNIIKNVFIKDFHKFTNKEAFNPLQKGDRHGKQTLSILDLEGKAWKEVRNVLSPTFTGAKMKQMVIPISSSIKDILKKMHKMAAEHQEAEVHKVYQRLTLDVITRTAFGIRTDVQKNPHSSFMRAVLLLVNTPYKDLLTFIGLCFPAMQNVCLELQNNIMRIINRGKKPALMLVNEIRNMLSYRKSNCEVRKSDLLQLMIDSKIKDDALINDPEDQNKNDDVSKIDPSRSSLRTMAEDEIIASSIAVMLAGYETTSTFLTYATYIMCTHQEIQEKLFQEVDQLIQSQEPLDYSTIHTLPYLEKVMSECLRMYPPVPLFTNRYALEEVHYGNVKIPKGVLVQAPVYIMHHDPEYWEDPEKFDPERFNTKPNSDGITYLPFGAGPRSCLGMRFAQLEGKLALAHLVHNFKFRLSDKQPENLKIAIRLRTQCPMSGVRVKLESRHEEVSI